MIAIVKLIATVAIALFVGLAVAEPVVVQGEELKNLIVTKRGTTWVLNNDTQTQVSFLPDNKIYACDILKNGTSDCDGGTYTVSESRVETKFGRWYAKTGGERMVVIKKDGDNLTLNDSEVVQYTRIPTLFQPIFELTKPAADVPPQCAAFNGRWTGTWTNGDQDWLSIVEVDAKCVAKFAYLSNPKVPTRFRVAEIKNAELSIQCGDGTCRFTVHGDEIWGNYSGPDGVGRVVKKKIQ